MLKQYKNLNFIERKKIFSKKKENKRLLERSFWMQMQSHKNIGGNVISLTGPAIKEHLNNFAIAKRRHHIIFEIDKITYDGIKKYQSKTVHIENNDLWKNLKKTVFKYKRIATLDLDFCQTWNAIKPNIEKYLLPLLVNNDLFTNKLSIIITYSQRDYNKSHIFAFQELIEYFNALNNWNYKIMSPQHHSYGTLGGGTPMCTDFFILSKV